MNRKSPKRIWQEEAKRQGICIGIEKMRDAVAAMWNTMQSLDELDEAAEKLLAEQEKK